MKEKITWSFWIGILDCSSITKEIMCDIDYPDVIINLLIEEGSKFNHF